MERVTILTGGNIGNLEYNMHEARRLLEREIGREVAASSVMESAPWGFTSGNNFLNQVLVFETELSPEAVLERCLAIEKLLGRERKEVDTAERVVSGCSDSKYGEKIYTSRTIDIDVLFYGDRVIETPDLIIPHPLIGERIFVLNLLVEIMPDLIHPVTGETMRQMLEKLTDE